MSWKETGTWIAIVAVEPPWRSIVRRVSVWKTLVERMAASTEGEAELKARTEDLDGSVRGRSEIICGFKAKAKREITPQAHAGDRHQMRTS
jgi:hypothetical protein